MLEINLSFIFVGSKFSHREVVTKQIELLLFL